MTADLHWVLPIVPHNLTWHPSFQQAIVIRTFSILFILQMKESEAEIKLPKLENCRATTGTQEARKQLVPFTITRSANQIIRKGHWWEPPRKRKSMRPGVSRKWLGQRWLTCHRLMEGSLLRMVWPSPLNRISANGTLKRPGHQGKQKDAGRFKTPRGFPGTGSDGRSGACAASGFPGACLVPTWQKEWPGAGTWGWDFRGRRASPLGTGSGAWEPWR